MTTPTVAAASPLEALIAQLNATLGAFTPATQPAAPTPTAQAKWDAYGEDKVVVKILANGRGVNKHGMFLSRATASDPKGLYAQYDAGKKARKPKAAAAPTPAPQATQLEGLVAQLLTALGAPQAAAPANTLASLVRQDGTWWRCLQCEDAYWGTHNSAETVLKKATKHVASKHGK